MSVLLFSDSVAQTVMTQVPVWEIAFAALVATSLSIWFGRSRFETALLKRLRVRKNFWRLAEMTSISLFGQALMLLSYVLRLLSWSGCLAEALTVIKVQWLVLLTK
jgi:hypothetical protein